MKRKLYNIDTETYLMVISEDKVLVLHEFINDLQIFIHIKELKHELEIKSYKG